MTKEQFVSTVMKRAGRIPDPLLAEFIKKKLESVYEPALEDNEPLQMERAIKLFAIAAESIDDLVAELADLANELNADRRGKSA